LPARAEAPALTPPCSAQKTTTLPNQPPVEKPQQHRRGRY
jgi:hypothetical protein